MWLYCKERNVFSVNSDDRNKGCFHLLSAIHIRSHSDIKEVPQSLLRSLKCLFACLVAQGCPTLCNPMDCSPPGSSVHADSPGKNSGVGCVFQGIFPTQGLNLSLLHCSSVQSLVRVRLFATPWTSARQASLSITNSRSSLRLMSIESVMPSSHLILCRPLLLLPPIPPSIRVFSNESALRMRWPKYWEFQL